MKFRFIFTTSIIEPEREEIYVKAIRDSLSKISHLPFEFYIVENNGQRKTLLDTIEGVNILYTETNNRDFRKGTKEFHDISLVSERYNFDDEDVVIKLTGRYTLENPPRFLESLVELEKKYDSFMKWMHIWGGVYLYDDCILGLVALRHKYMKEFNYMRMESHPSMEHVFADFVRSVVPEERIIELKHLGLYHNAKLEWLV